MLNCTTNRYAELYARWLENPGTLLDLAEWEPGMSLLDLCGGTGAVSQEAIRRGALPSDIVLLDLNPRASNTEILQVRGRAEDVRPLLQKHQFDVVVCRQALAYLDLGGDLFRNLALVLKPRGQLVFNTFPWPRTTSRWVFKSYEYEGRHYYEAALCLSRHVWHLQANLRLGVDVTRFRGYTEAEIRGRVEPHFTVQVDQSARSLRWVCTRSPR